MTDTITVGRQPFGVAVDPGAGTIYVANNADDTVSVIDRATNTVTATITVGDGPQAVAVDPTTHLIYVSNFYDDTVSVIDGATNAVTATIGVGDGPYGVGVDPTTHMIYVANYYGGDDTVTVINGATNTVVATIPVGSYPYGVGVDPTNSRVYVTNYGDGTMSVIDGATNTVVQTIPLVGGSQQQDLWVDPGTHTIYVSNSADGTVSVINGLTGTVTATIVVGQYPYGLGVDPGSHRLYVVNSGHNTVSVIDSLTNTVIETVAAGTSPVGLAVDPNTGTVYVTSNAGKLLSVINRLIAQAVTFTSTAPSGALIGDAYTATATGGASGVPVVFSSASAGICTATAAGVVSFVGVGACVIDANQAGVGEYTAAPQVSQSVPVAKAATSTTLAADQYHVVAGQQVTLMATVTSPGVGTPTGSVTFTEGGTSLGTGVLDGSGVATLPVDMLVAGAHSIVVSYPGDGSVVGSVSSAVTVTVYPAAVDHLVVSPPSATIVAGGDQAYTATSFDAFDNLIGDVTDDTVFTVDAGANCAEAICSSTATGDYTVTGAYQIPAVGFAGAGFAALAAAVAVGDTVTATAELHVTAASVDHLVISPSSATVLVGAGQAYTAGAFDEFGNLIADVTAGTRFTIDGDASCTGVTCTPAAAGSYTVTGTYEALSDTAALTATVAVAVTPPAAPDAEGTPPLAATGADMAWYAELSSILLLVGIALLGMGRVRRRIRR